MYKTSNKVMYLLGVAFGVYFIIYPMIYFAWNIGIELLGFAQYQIPSFWGGMLVFLVFIVVKNIIKGIFQRPE